MVCVAEGDDVCIHCCSDLGEEERQWTFDLVIDLGPTVVVEGAPAEMSEKVRRTERAWWLQVYATIMIGL